MQLAGIDLDPQHDWIDKYEWEPVAKTQDCTLTGKLLVQKGAKVHGRPITLDGTGCVWTPLSVVRQLEALRDQPGLVMALVLPDGRAFSVIFNHAEGAPLVAKPVHREVNPAGSEPFEITLRLISVAPLSVP
ncbi:hypothetical protein PSGK_15345 [Pseudomonas solani]|uniref:hypothetical protein n=1 Tax=Pseudomonas solani TaxID=2731552 RepID=UPI0035BE3D61